MTTMVHMHIDSNDVMIIITKYSASYTVQINNGVTVVHTEDIYVEHVNRDIKWWEEQLIKFQIFYFKALLPELAHPRYGSGGIREPH